MLRFDGGWRFDSPGALPEGSIGKFFEWIGKLAAQGDYQAVLEHFKSHFLNSIGAASSWSSTPSWAEHDLLRAMETAAANAPVFIEAFYDACQTLKERQPDIYMPEVDRINRLLAEAAVGYEIRPPRLVRVGELPPVSITAVPLTLDERVRETIQQSLKESESQLAQGHGRQAVQEILWLLESVVTAFRGIDTDEGTVEGKYFNKIALELRRNHRGQTLEQVLNWILSLHGYLSSPTGGGVRHGADLKAGVVVSLEDARLFCNLVRSYVGYLLTEYDRLSTRS